MDFQGSWKEKVTSMKLVTQTKRLNNGEKSTIYDDHIFNACCFAQAEKRKSGFFVRRRSASRGPFKLSKMASTSTSIQLF